jgi:hypothetical protein
MASSEIYAGGVRAYLWSKGQLDSLQQEMFFKNLLFLVTIATAFLSWRSTKTRRWNSRRLPFGLMLPSREMQRQLFRWSFCILYLIEGSLMTAILVGVAPTSSQAFLWGIHLLCDIILVTHFFYYCRNSHIQNVGMLILLFID